MTNTTMQTTFQIGDRVCRKGGRVTIGVIERIAPSGRMYVRWENALRPFSGGYGDNHSFVQPAALLPLTPKTEARRQARIATAQQQSEARTVATMAKHQARWDNLQPGQIWNLYCPQCVGSIYHHYCGEVAGQRQFECPRCGTTCQRNPQPMVWQ